MKFLAGKTKAVLLVELAAVEVPEINQIMVTVAIQNPATMATTAAAQETRSKKGRNFQMFGCQMLTPTRSVFAKRCIATHAIHSSTNEPKMLLKAFIGLTPKLRSHGKYWINTARNTPDGVNICFKDILIFW